MEHLLGPQMVSGSAPQAQFNEPAACNTGYPRRPGAINLLPTPRR